MDDKLDDLKEEDFRPAHVTCKSRDRSLTSIERRRALSAVEILDPSSKPVVAARRGCG